MKKPFHNLVTQLLPLLRRGLGGGLFFSFLFFAGTEAFAQKQGQERIDSLLLELPKAKIDTIKINILNELSELAGWQIGEYDIAKNYATEALSLSQKTKYRKGKARAYNNIGIIYAQQGNYPEALENFFASLKIKEEIGHKYGIANAYNSIGNIYMYQENYPEALDNYFAGLKIMEETGNKSGIAYVYCNIGNVYDNQGNYPEALENYFAALKIMEETGNKSGTAYSYIGIGEVYLSQGKYSEALENFMAALEMRETIGDKYGMTFNLIIIGITYVEMGDATTGKFWLQKGLALSKELGVKKEIKDGYEGLVKADSTSGNFKGAYENYKLFIIYRDSLFNEENTKKLTQIEMQYEFDKKEALAQAEQEKKDILARENLAKAKSNRNLALVGVGVFMIVAVFSGIGYRQKRKSNKIISIEKQKSDDLLLNILPEEVAAELKTTGTSEAKHFDSVSIMFTDFKEFTKLSEKMSSKELIEELNYCFKAFDEIIVKHGIEKIKTIGDAYMAVCGLPVPQDNHAQKMIEAALEIRDFMNDYKQKRQSEGKTFFEMRIGINSGEVVAGIVGIKKFAYDIWGDAVNIAARMESNGAVGKVNISESTFNLIKDDFACKYRGEIEAKGKGKINMYFAEPKNRL